MNAKAKLDSMTPEEIETFTKENCVFCKIVDNKISSNVIYKDDDFLAILDIKPATNGHVLLFPRKHITITPQLPDEVFAQMLIVAKKISNAILKGMKAQGTSLFVANGISAGQKCQHVLLHIIPRYKNDELGL